MSETYTEEDLKRWAQAIASAGWTAVELIEAVEAFTVALQGSDETSGLTLDELLGPEGAALIRANKMTKP